jgi:hypothetical protein
MRAGRKISVAVLLGLTFYVGTFSYWWMRSPATTTTTKTGVRMHAVDFQFNKISWRTRVIWLPAFWFMKRVCGYQEGGFAPMYDESIFTFVK